MYEEIRKLIESKLGKGQKLLSISPVGEDAEKNFVLVLTELLYKGIMYYDLRYFSYSSIHSGFMKNGIRLRKEHIGNAHTLLEINEREDE